MVGKTCLITGAASGIGKETALALARMGAEIVLVARDRERGAKVREEIEAGGGKAGLLVADLASREQVRRLAAEIEGKCPRLDVLINDAGLYLKDRTLTGDGIETSLAVNYLAPFLLTRLLLDRLKASAPSRILNVASRSHRGAVAEFGDLEGRELHEAGRDGKMYGRAKAWLFMFTYELARRLEGRAVAVNALCPGGVATGIWKRNRDFRSRLVAAMMGAILKGPRQGARLPVYLASSSEVEGVSGRYFEVPAHLRFSSFDVRGTEAESDPATYDESAQRRLWDLTSSLVGLSP